MTDVDVVGRRGREDVPGEADSDEVALQPTPTAELGEPAEDVRLAVDPPKGTLTVAELTGLDLPERRVIVPRWLRSRAEARAVAVWCVRYVLSLATFHVTRAPLYAVRAVTRSVIGAGRTVASYWRWLWDLQGRQMARAAHAGADQQAWAKARREWQETVHRRAIGSAVAVVLAAGVVVAAYLLLPPWGTALVGATALLLLIRAGAPEDKPLVDAYYTSRAGDTFRLTSKAIVRALGSIGVAGINQALREDPKDGVRFPKPITTDGPGFRAEVDLPHGVTAAQIMEKRTELASGLRRPLGTVWPEAMPDVHAGRLALWVGNTEVSNLHRPAPYEKSNWKGDAFGDVPFGFDQRGRPVAFELMYSNALIGSLPGAGKTGAVRGLLLALSLDPTVELRVAEHKGSGDLSMFEPIAHFYVSGVADEDVEATLQQLRGLLREADRRAAQIKHLGKTTDLAPESKVTRRSAARRELGLWPIIMVIDEAQEVFGHDEHGAEAGKLAERLVKRGRALGIILVIATQRPDKQSLPTGITANVAVRFCLRVADQVTNDMILGTSAYKQGVQATTLSVKDKGVGYLRGAFDGAIVVRAYYSDKPAAEKITRRAVELRRVAGTITGQAAGDAAERAHHTILDDLPTVFVTAERLHSETIVTRLQALGTGAYDRWSTSTLASVVRDQLGLRTVGLKIDGVNRQGLRRDAVLDAVGDALLPAQVGQAPDDGRGDA